MQATIACLNPLPPVDFAPPAFIGVFGDGAGLVVCRLLELWQDERGNVVHIVVDVALCAGLRL